jgi:hypothetical protein
MNRNKDLVEKRIQSIGLYYELKKAAGIPRKVAVMEIAEALNIGLHTINNSLTKYKKRVASTQLGVPFTPGEELP